MLESRQIALPAYLVSAAMITVPLADACTSLYPWHLGDARWRFGAVGLVSNAMLIPMVGILVAFVTATGLDHRLARRVIGIVSFVAAVVCALAIISFALDALQTRASVRPEMQLSFTVATLTAGIKTLLFAATFVALGLAARRGAVTRKGERDVPLFSASKGQRPSQP